MSSAPRPLEIEVAPRGADCVVQLRGEIDLSSSPALRSRLLEALDAGVSGRIVLDMSGVSYVDSSGVGTIVELKRRADRTSTGIVLVGLQPRVRSVFEITRLDRFLEIVATLDDARKD